MKTHRSLFAIGFLVTLCIPVSLHAFQEMIPLEKFTGTVRQAELRQVAPESGVITSAQKLKILWNTWKIQEPVPRVSFATQMMLVTTVDGPNRTFSGPLRLKDGHLTYKVLSTKRTGPGFGYLVMLVDREGIDRVNDIPLAQPAAPKMKPVEQPAIEDAIRVDIIGTVETGMMAVGAETTGNVIRANGVQWELDFQNARQLQLAKSLHGQKVRVRGDFFQLEGVETGTRRIVMVSSLSPAAAAMPSEKVRPVASTDQTQPPIDQVNQPAAQKAPSKVDVSKLKAFNSITYNVKMIDQNRTLVQSVDRLGKVTRKLNDQVETWQVPPAQVKLLHSLVEMTNWRDYPRNSRSTDPRGFEYSITITTPKGATRIFLDGGALEKQPLVVKMFDLMNARMGSAKPN